MTQASTHQWERVQSVAGNAAHPDNYLAACLLELRENAVSKQQLPASPCRESVDIAKQPPLPIASDDEIHAAYNNPYISTTTEALRTVYLLGRYHGSL